MRVLLRIELARCSRAELHTMLHAITAQLPFLPEQDLRAAHANLQAIRSALTRPTFGSRWMQISASLSPVVGIPKCCCR